MAPHPSTLVWKIPWTEEPGRLQSMGSLRVRHDWVSSLSLFTFMHGRRKWQPTPVFLPGESQGWGAWWAAVYGVAQSQTWLKWLSSSSSSGSDGKESTCNAGDMGSTLGLGRSPGGGHDNPLQYLAWRIPGTGEPGGLQSTVSQRVGHDWVTRRSTHEDICRHTWAYGLSVYNLHRTVIGCGKHTINDRYYQFSSVQLLSRVWLFVTPWTAACQLTSENSELKTHRI